MKCTINKLLIVPALAVLLSGYSQLSLGEEYRIDPRHSGIEFEISHLGFSMMQGNFETLSGYFTYVPGKPKETAISVVIDTASVDTNDAERDKHLRDKKFLNVKKFPEAKFESTSAKVSDKGGSIKGNLTLHGVTKEITIKVDVVGAGNDPWGGYRRGYIGHTTIKRSDYDMNHNLGSASDDMKLRLFIEGIRK